MAVLASGVRVICSMPNSWWPGLMREGQAMNPALEHQNETACNQNLLSQLKIIGIKLSLQ